MERAGLRNLLLRGQDLLPVPRPAQEQGPHSTLALDDHRHQANFFPSLGPSCPTSQYRTPEDWDRPLSTWAFWTVGGSKLGAMERDRQDICMSFYSSSLGVSILRGSTWTPGWIRGASPLVFSSYLKLMCNSWFFIHLSTQCPKILQGDRILCTPGIREGPYSLSFGRYLSADPSGSPLYTTQPTAAAALGHPSCERFLLSDWKFLALGRC